MKKTKQRNCEGKIHHLKKRTKISNLSAVKEVKVDHAERPPSKFYFVHTGTD